MTLDARIKKAYFAWLKADSREASVNTRTKSISKRELAESTERAYAELSALLAERKAVTS